MLLGYTSAFITSIFFSLYLVPRKFSKASPTAYVYFVGLGFTVLSMLSYIFTGRFADLANPILIISCVCGILWSIAAILFAKSIDKIGISRCNQWKNLQGPIGVITSAIFLAEKLSIHIVVTILAIFFSAALLTIKKDGESTERLKGISLAILAAVIFGSISTMQKYVTIHAGVQAQQLLFATFVFIGAAVNVWLQDKSLPKFKGNLHGIVAGSIYFFASLSQLTAYKFLPNVIVSPIIQLNAVWTILIGVLIFKEIDFKRHWARICSGIGLAIIGVVVLWLQI